MLLTYTSAHLSTAKMHKKFTTLTFLQGQAIYQVLHILVSITQPIVESGYFSRFIWPSREVESFCLTRHPLNATGHYCLDGCSPFCVLRTVRQLECEQMSCGCHQQLFLSISVLLLSLSSFRTFFSRKLSLWTCMFLRFNLICLTLYDDEKPSISFSFSLYPSAGFSFCTPTPFCYPLCHPSLSDFLDLFVLFSASHSLPPSLSLSVVEW